MSNAANPVVRFTIKHWSLALTAACTAMLAAPTEAAVAELLPHDNLLLYHDKSGAGRPVKSLGDWRKRRAEILQRMQDVMGPLPGLEKRCALDLKVEEETDCGDYLRRFITYAAEPGSRVPAYLLIPKSALTQHQLPAGPPPGN